MTAPKQIWVYRFSDGHENPVLDSAPTIAPHDHDRYTRADAPELQALVRAAKAFEKFIWDAAPHLVDEDRGACVAGVGVAVDLELAVKAYEALK